MLTFKYCRFERDNDFLRVFLTNIHIICRSGELNLELSYLVNRYSPRKMRIDFTHVLYFSREAINDLLLVRRNLIARGSSLEIYGMQPSVFSKFHSLRLDRNVFAITPHPDFVANEIPGAGSRDTASDVNTFCCPTSCS